MTLDGADYEGHAPTQNRSQTKKQKDKKNMTRKEKPIIKGEAKILNEKGEVIGIATVAYWNPKYKPWTLERLVSGEIDGKA